VRSSYGQRQIPLPAVQGRCTMPISSLRYVSGSSSSEEELRIWRMSLSAIFETRVEDVDAFRLSMEGWNLGALVLGSIETVAQRYERSRRMVVGGGLDHYLLQLYVSGGFRSVNG